MGRSPQTMGLGGKTGDAALASRRTSWGVQRARCGEDGERRAHQEPTTEELEIIVMQIKRLSRAASLEFALSVGAVIVHHFYNGDTGAWRLRGSKSSSFRKLAEHPELPFSAGALYRCVAIFELCERLHAPSRWGYLGASHLRLVLGLSPGTQEKLLTTANANRWTVKVLHQEVLRERGKVPSYGGRRVQPPIAKSLKSVRKCLEEHRRMIAQLHEASGPDLQGIVRVIEETKTSLERLSLSLQVAMASEQAE
jgi:hypothetical protein